jgi:UDP-N-acetylmuramate dehydrogenase
MKLEKDKPLSPLTTFRVGGSAKYFVEVSSERELQEALVFAHEKNVPVFILGGGSNIIIHDNGFSGVVIKNAIKGFEASVEKDAVSVTAGAGESWDSVVQRCVEKNWAGIENLSAVPGTVGAAPIQNIGCYGASFEEVADTVWAIEMATGKVREFSKEECQFEYRESFFKKAGVDAYCVTKVRMRLQKNGAANISYRDLTKYFAGRGKTPTISEVRQALIEIRTRKGMTILPGLPSYFSAGSFFKNPIVPQAEMEKIEKVAATRPDIMKRWTPWNWPQPDGRVKLSAAFLLEYTPFVKGYVRGGVGISPKHTLALINLGKADAAELVALGRDIQQNVQDLFGVLLEAEVRFVGFPEYPLLK